MEYGGGQYSTTSYGAQGGVGGGGFMGGSQGGSQSAGAGKGTYGKDTLRPVSIMQVLNASQPHPDADFSIDDVEITQVTFVGQIRNISTQATNVTYKLDDGTGTIEVKQWIDTSDGTSLDDSGSTIGAKPKLVENEWARVWGRLKAFNNRRHVGAHVIRPITDKMEITYHLLEATFVHLYFTRGPVEQLSKTAGEQGQYGIQSGGAAGVAAGGAGAGAGQMTANVSLTARRVLQALKETPQTNEGLHVQNIAALLKLNVNEVMKAGDELLNHSLIFTTTDDLTWAFLEF